MFLVIFIILIINITNALKTLFLMSELPQYMVP